MKDVTRKLSGCVQVFCSTIQEVFFSFEQLPIMMENKHSRLSFHLNHFFQKQFLENESPPPPLPFFVSFFSCLSQYNTCALFEPFLPFPPDVCSAAGAQRTRPVSGNCRGYYLCVSGRSVPMCCPMGYAYSKFGCLECPTCRENCMTNAPSTSCKDFDPSPFLVLNFSTVLPYFESEHPMASRNTLYTIAESFTARLSLYLRTKESKQRSANKPKRSLLC